MEYTVVSVPSFDFGPALEEVMNKEIPKDMERDDEPHEDSMNPSSENNAEDTDFNVVFQTIIQTLATASNSPMILDPSAPSVFVHTTPSTMEPGLAHAQCSRNEASHRRRRRKRGEKRAAIKDANGADHADLPERIAKRIKSSSEVVKTELPTNDLAVAHGGYVGRGGYIKGYTVSVSPSKGLGMGFRLVKIDPAR